MICQLQARKFPNRGFSLLELLVVVFIIGILATMFTLSLGVLGGDSELEKETDRLQALIRLAAEEAITQGREYGVHFYPDGYEFAWLQEAFDKFSVDEDGQRLEIDEWMIVGGDSLLMPRSLPEAILIEVEIEGRELVLKPREEAFEAVPDDVDDVNDSFGLGDADDADDAYRPQVWIYSSGDLSPFTVRIRREFSDLTYQLDFAEDGSVELTEQ